MRKILHVVGNRPQFIKLAPVFHELSARDFEQIIIHSGQHYDANMSDVFFEELNIPLPDENLEVGSGSHAEITGKALIKLENMIEYYHPQMVLLYGDTNTTLAGGVACCKLNYPFCHIEAGIRTFDKKNPEENNRIMVDHVSDYLFCADQASVQNLRNEGLDKNVFFSGDVMLDVFLKTDIAEEGLKILKKFALYEKEYYLMTWHRQENTGTAERMKSIIDLIKRMDKKVLCPLHPRTKSALTQAGLWEEVIELPNFIYIEPVGYKEMVTFNRYSAGVICDSGGLSKEASFAGNKCLFMLGLDVWPELTESGWIKQYVAERDDSDEALHWFMDTALPMKRPELFGNGNAAGIIADTLESLL